MRRSVYAGLLAASMAAAPSCGEVLISEIFYNLSGSESSTTEWIEIYNSGSSAVDLTNWSWGDSQDNSFTGGFGSTTLNANEAAVLLFQDTAQFQSMWGSNVKIIQTDAGISLSNSASATNETVVLRNASNAIVDSVNYENSSNGWPNDTGNASIYLRPNALSTTANDVGANWANSSSGVDGATTALTMNPGISNASLLDIASPGVVASPPPPPPAPNHYVGQNLLGEAYNGWRPPDTMGAVGPNHTVTLVNGGYNLRRKGESSTVESSDLINFWRNQAGLGSSITFAFDPRITYDPSSKRYYAVAVEEARSANNEWLFAVSKTSNPEDGWDGFRWRADPTGGVWADYPMIGFDEDPVYLSANMFVVANSSSAGHVWVLPKDDLTGANPTVANRQQLFMNLQTWQMTDSFDGTSAATGTPYVIWDDSTTSFFARNITESGGNYAVSSSFSVDVTDRSFGASTSRQPGDTPSSVRLESLNSRFTSRLVRINGSIYGVHMVDEFSGAPDNSIRFSEIDADTLVEKQEIIVKIPGADLIYPSVAVNEDGDVVIGFTATGPSQRAAAFAVVGRTENGVTTFGTPFMLRDGDTDLYQNVASGRNRWGDYSSTKWDPADPDIFYTWQEFADSSSNWGVQQSEIITFEDNEFRWKDAVSGDFGASAGWANAAVPGANDTVIFSRPGAAHTVNVNSVSTRRLEVRQGDTTLNLSGTYRVDVAEPPAFGGPADGAELATGDAALVLSPFEGASVLTLNGSGALEANGVAIAVGEGSSATLNVNASSGSNAGLKNVGDLSVGGTLTAPGGVGVLNVGNDGRMSTAIQTKVWANSAVNVAGQLNVFNIDNDGVISLTNAGLLTASTVTGAGVIQISGNAVAIIDSLRQSVAVSGNGGMQINPSSSGGALSVAPSVSTTSGGQLDLQDNDLIITDDTDANVRALLVSGFNSGGWNGPGINSSTAAADPATTLGYATAGDLGISSYDSVSVASDDVIVKYTYFGDADLSGVIDFNDLMLFISGFNGTSDGWFFGDFDYNNTIDFNDLSLFIAGFNGQVGPLSPADKAALDLAIANEDLDAAVAALDAAGLPIPEPTSLALVGLGTLMLRRRR